MAVVLSLPPSEAQKLLLLAEYASNQTLAMHSKGSEPLNTVQITNGPGYYSSSKPLLLSYHYASPDQGPSSGKQLLIYNRCWHWMIITAKCCLLLPFALCLLSFAIYLCQCLGPLPFACCLIPHAQMAVSQARAQRPQHKLSASCSSVYYHNIPCITCGPGAAFRRVLQTICASSDIIRGFHLGALH